MVAPRLRLPPFSPSVQYPTMSYIDYETLQNADVSPVQFIWNVLDHLKTKMSPREVFEHYLSHTEPCIQDIAYWAYFKALNHPFADQINIAFTIAKFTSMFSQSSYVAVLDFVESVGAIRTPIAPDPSSAGPTGGRKIFHPAVRGYRSPLFSDPYLVSYGALDNFDQSILLVPTTPAVFTDAAIYANNDVELMNRPIARHYTYILRNRGSDDGLLAILERLSADPEWDNGEPKRILIPEASFADRVSAVAALFPVEQV